MATWDLIERVSYKETDYINYVPGASHCEENNVCTFIGFKLKQILSEWFSNNLALEMKKRKAGGWKLQEEVGIMNADSTKLMISHYVDHTVEQWHFLCGVRLMCVCVFL